MTTIGFATLQIIPSLKGVSEAIEKEVAGKSVRVSVDPTVNTKAAQKAGKEAGEAVTKEVKSAVRKGDIGKTVHDEIKSSAKSSPGKEAAKAVVDGLADGIKKELPRRDGPVGSLIDGIADGVKQGIDGVGIGGQVVDTIGTGIKSGNLGGTLKDALIPAVKNIGDEIRSSAASWSGDIADSLRSGDIQGATNEISATVQQTTDLISDIGSTFGLQLDGVRNFGTQASTVLSQFGTDVQNGINTAGGIRDTLNGVGTLLETVLPGKAGTGAGKIAAALSNVSVPAWLLYLTTNTIGDWREQQKYSNGDPVSRFPSPIDLTPGRRSNFELIFGPLGTKLDEVFGTGQRGKPAPGVPAGVDINPRFKIGSSYGGGGYTGSMSKDRVAGVVHGGEYVINANATSSIQKSMPGLLGYLNALPGYANGGLVAGANQLRSIIAQQFGISNIGGWRPADKYGEHSTGRALDVMTSNKALGDAVKDFAVANSSAIDLKWAIWQQRLWYPGGGSKTMPDRGSPTANHMDHVHIFSGPGITNGLRGALSAGQQADATYTSSMMAMPDPTGISAPDETGPINSAATPQTSAKVQLASSFSGLAGTGLGDLGKGVGKTKSGSDLSVFGNAAEAAVTGQVSSALGVLGVNDSPGWLRGASMLLNSASISDGAGSAAPLSAGTPAMSAAGSALNAVQAGSSTTPMSVTNYNIQTTDLEPAYLVSQRHQKERAAAEMSRF